MASWSCREKLIRQVEFLVPLNYPADEFYKALDAARSAWQEMNRGKAPGGDFATVTADDEYVIIRVIQSTGVTP